MQNHSVRITQKNYEEIPSSVNDYAENKKNNHDLFLKFNYAKYINKIMEFCISIFIN